MPLCVEVDNEYLGVCLLAVSEVFLNREDPFFIIPIVYYTMSYSDFWSQDCLICDDLFEVIQTFKQSLNELPKGNCHKSV